MQNDDSTLEVLLQIRNWIRAAAHDPVKKNLERALPDAKSRAAYQMLDGTASMDSVRIACKMSPNALVALASRCEQLGLMELNHEKKRIRLFDLSHFGLQANGQSASE